MLEQPVPEGLHPVGGTHAVTVQGGMSPVEGPHAGAGAECEESSP